MNLLTSSEADGESLLYKTVSLCTASDIEHMHEGSMATTNLCPYLWTLCAHCPSAWNLLQSIELQSYKSGALELGCICQHQFPIFQMKFGTWTAPVSRSFQKIEKRITAGLWALVSPLDIIREATKGKPHHILCFQVDHPDINVFLSSGNCLVRPSF